MESQYDFLLILHLGFGVLWIITYILIIKRGFEDKTYGMPMAAICANISWEFIFSFIYPQDGLQKTITMIWFILDMVIMLQYLIYGHKEFKRHMSAKFFYLFFFITLGLSFFIIMAITFEFNDFQGKYAAFLQNLMMSGLFILLFIRRGNLKGQSRYIAVFKMMGTLLASIAFFMYSRSCLITIVSIAIFIYDWIYTIFIWKVYSRNRYTM